MRSAVFEYLIFNAQDLPFSAHYTAAEITLRNPCPDGRGWPAPADRVRGTSTRRIISTQSPGGAGQSVASIDGLCLAFNSVPAFSLL